MSVELKLHNLIAYNAVKEILERENRVAVVHPTGTGKSFVALKLVEENPDKKVIYLSPSIPIMIQFKKNMRENDVSFRNVRRISYQKLTSLLKNNELHLDADIIILDEFHHCGAPEWGKAVRELLKQNSDAQVLGLSATPVRYLDDEVRDMAEELFDNNIASEMTLEEAIAAGILREPIYTTGLYEYEQITSELEEKIEKCSDLEKREIAQNELERLREMLQASVRGLPELLEKSMTNRNGRYIVYCKDIADMEKKMEEVSELFGRVNPNMEIMSISSRDEDIRRDAYTIENFEREGNDDKLKLLFSVNMLNEGYHLSKLDGVIMMRPTHSPTLYYQQLGRALSVGQDRQPIVIDLVNNIDTIEIVEGFSKSLGEAKERKQQESSTRFAISDEIREIRKIVAKIDELVARRKLLSNEEKLKLMTEYMSVTGEKIVQGTIYKGYNLGAFRNNLRQAYYNGTLNMDADLLQVFIDAGIILEEKERIRTSEQEKYDFLISLLEKSPEERKDARMESGMSFANARNWLQLQYNRGRLNLSEEQIALLKANGLLNLSPQEKDDLKKKHEVLLSYGIELEEILDIEKKYGSFEIFMDKWKRGECEYSFKNPVFVGFRGIAIASREITEEQKANYAELIVNVFEIEEDITYKSKLYIDIDEIDKALAKLKEREQQILRMYYGIGVRKYTCKEICEEIGISQGYFAALRGKTERYLRLDLKRKNTLRDSNEELLDNQRICQKISSKIQHINRMRECIDEKGNLKTCLTAEELEKFGLKREELEDFFSIIMDSDGSFRGVSRNQTEKRKEERERASMVLVENLNLPRSIIKSLKDAGIATVSDILSIGPDHVIKLGGTDSRYFYVLEEMKKLGFEIEKGTNEEQRFYYAREFDELKDDIFGENILIEELNLSKRCYTRLKRANINAISDIIKAGPDELLIGIRDFGRKSYEELEKVMESLGYGIDVDKNGNKKFIYIQKGKDEENFATATKPFTLFEQCDKAIADLNEELDKAKTERLLIEKKKTEGYARACKFYLEHENILDPNAIVPAIERREKVQSSVIDSDTAIDDEELLDESSQEQKRKKELLESIRTNQAELARLTAELAELEAHDDTTLRYRRNIKWGDK